MYKKCENCYKDGKTPNKESCKKCEDDLKAKEQECEELKEQLELNTANAVVIDMAQRLYKLKQTLIEIEEIAETCSFTDNIQLLLNRFEQILQKISECEGNDEKH